MGDVAQAAGVSKATVSLILNGRADEIGIAKETQSRVLAVVETRGYRRNQTARVLRLRKSRTIGVLTDHIATSPFAGRTLLGAQSVAWEQGILLLIVDTGARQSIEKAATEALQDRGVDGFLYAAESWGPIAVPAAFESVPSVLVNCRPSAPSPHASAVVPCEVEGGRLATEELLRHGHRRIAYLGGIADLTATREREVGFREAMATAGIPVVQQWTGPKGDYNIRSGYRLCRRVFEAPGERPTALFCGNDRMAVGAIVALHEVGLAVPRDVSVVGYDDQPTLADEFVPALTTVSIPHYEMGATAAAELLARISSTLDAPFAAEVPVPGQLVRRDSVGPPPSPR